MKMKWIMGNKREVREGMKESYKRHMGGGLIFTGSFAELDEFSVLCSCVSEFIMRVLFVCVNFFKCCVT